MIIIAKQNTVIRREKKGQKDKGGIAIIFE